MTLTHSKTLIPFFAALLLTRFAAAETLTLTQDGSNVGHPFADALGWSDGLPPHDGNGYVVDSERILTAGNKDDGAGQSLAFGGDFLQVGTEVSAGVFYHRGNIALTVADLRLVKGRYRCWSTKTSIRTKTMRGSTTVLSPSTAPFQIMPSHDAGTTPYTVLWEATLKGAEGTGLKIEANPDRPASTFRFVADNSDYKGLITATGDRLRVLFDTATSLGGPLETFEQDALTLANGAELAASQAGIRLDSAQNRGIRIVDSAKICADENAAWTLGWPVSGSGILAKAGTGTLCLDAAVGSGLTLSVTDGFLSGGANMSFEAGASLDFAGGGIHIDVVSAH